jgi:hypothetical protein
MALIFELLEFMKTGAYTPDPNFRLIDGLERFRI